MKTLSVLALVLSVGGYCLGQGAEIVEYGPTTAGKMATNHIELQESLKKLLDKADEQLKKLEEQLKRTGDYLAVENSEAVIAAKVAMETNGVTSVKTNAELATMREGAKGEDVFDSANNVAGVFKATSKTYMSKEKDAEGKDIVVERERDPNEYTVEAKKLADIKEFYDVREAAIIKQKNLEEARIQAHKDLLKTEDAVETQRLTAFISSIDAELIAVRQDVANASHELEMHEKAITLQQTVDAKSKHEDLGRKGTKAEDVMKMVNDMISAAAGRTAEEKKRGRLEERKAGTDPKEEVPEL